MDIATLDRVKALNTDAEAVVQWALTLEGALHRIEEQYAQIMKEPPAWVNMRPEQLTIAREAWYGASLIARKALDK